MDKETLQGKLTEYIALYNEIRQRINGEPRDALAILAEIGKDARMEQMKEEREKQNGDPATDKQKRFLKKLEIEFVPNLTKVQASALIDRALAKEPEYVS